MKIRIIRYKYLNTSLTANYFDMTADNYDDEMNFNEIFDEGFPVYNEEVNSKNGEFDSKASDFDIKFHLLQTSPTTNQPVVSKVKKLSIKEFLKPADGTIYKYAVLVDFENGKRIGGFMDVNKRSVNQSYNQNKYEIKFTVIDAQKEFSLWAGKPLPLDPIWGANHQIHIETFLLEQFWNSATNTNLNDGHNQPPKNLNFVFNFNWANRLGYEPVLVAEAYNAMLRNTIQEDCWTLFKELSYGEGFGIKFRPSFNQDPNAPFILFEIVTFWRTDGITNRNIDILDYLEENEINANRCIAFGYVQPNLNGSITRFPNGWPWTNLNNVKSFNPQHLYGLLIKSASNSFLCDGDDPNGNSSDPSKHCYYYDDTGDPNITQPAIYTWSNTSTRQPPAELNYLAYNNNDTLSDLKIYHRIYYLIGGLKNDGSNHYFPDSYFFANTIESYFNKVTFSRLFVQTYYLGNRHSFPPGGFSQTYSTEIRDNGWQYIVSKTADVEYNYLLGGSWNVLKIKIRFDFDTPIELFDKVNISGNNYWVRRITNIKLKEREAELELVQSSRVRSR